MRIKDNDGVQTARTTGSSSPNIIPLSDSGHDSTKISPTQPAAKVTQEPTRSLTP